MASNDWFEETSENKEVRSAGSDFYKLVEGDNKMRILTTPVSVKQAFVNGKYEFSDEAVPKFWAWAVIRATGELKIVKLPYSVSKQITMFSADPDYEFSEFPMPYDININAKNAGVKDVEYMTSAARKNTPVTAEELAALALKTPVADIVQKMKDKREGKAPEVKVMPEPTEEIDINDIPF